MSGTSSANDKFLLLSDNSVPVKPFKAMQRNLLKSSKSIFQSCEFRGGRCGYKTSQFHVLNRAHAELTAKTDVGVSRSSWKCRKQCLDEYYTLNTLFGNGNFGKTATGIDVVERRNAALMTYGGKRRKAEAQS